MTGRRLLGVCVAVFVVTALISGAITSSSLHGVRVALWVAGITAGVIGLFVALPWVMVELVRDRRGSRR